jgi:hypothetical protein
MLNKAGNRRGNPGEPKTRKPREKPCAICGLPIVAQFPSDLAKVRVHGGACKGLWFTKRAAVCRIDQLEPYLAGKSPQGRRDFLEGYRLGAIQTGKRLRARAQRQDAQVRRNGRRAAA